MVQASFISISAGQQLKKWQERKIHLGWFPFMASFVGGAILPYYVGLLASNKLGLSAYAATGTVMEDPTKIADFFKIPPVPSPTYQFPAPTLDKKKKFPKAKYTGRVLDEFITEDNENNSSKVLQWSLSQVNVHLKFQAEESKSEVTDENEKIEDNDDGDDPKEHGPYQPAGQHLLMDIRNVDTAFLDNVQLLAQNMVEIITESKLTLLSYHCHDLHAPMGVSCLGVLLESHVSLHTWPQAGVISLDLFTCGDGNLLPLIPLLQERFAVPAQAVDGDGNVGHAQPVISWSYKKRGYDNYYGKDGVMDNRDIDNFIPAMSITSDSERDLLGWNGFGNKRTMLIEGTDFQQVEIFETLQGGERVESGSTMGSKSHVQNKRIYLDGTLQSTRDGLEAYHEALVHPALLANGESQQRVAIIGGGEGATLREALKHKTVTRAVMIEIDREFVDISRNYLPEWNDCSDLILDGGSGEQGTSSSCFDDPRTELHYGDALSWFVDRHGKDKEIKEADKFSVIIMDALDPSSNIEFCDRLYGDETFVASLVNALEKENGVLVLQVGEHVYHSDLRSSHTRASTVLARFQKLLEKNGIRVMKSYAEGHGQFSGPWEFYIGFLGFTALSRFYHDPAIVDLDLTLRAVTTRSGQNPFRYFDGSTMALYQFPSRIEEDFFCRTRPEDSRVCGQVRGHDPDRANVPASTLEVGPSTIPDGGRGLFFTQDAAAGSYLALEESVHTMYVNPNVFFTASEMFDHSVVPDPWQLLVDSFWFGYGYSGDFYGEISYHVDCGISAFINHGCNSTYVVGSRTDENEFTASPERMSDDLMVDPREVAFYDPFLDRNHWIYESFEEVLEDVRAGQEVFGNYIEYLNEENWSSGLADYKAQCLRQSVGAIKRYELVHSRISKTVGAGASLNDSLTTCSATGETCNSKFLL